MRHLLLIILLLPQLCFTRELPFEYDLHVVTIPGSGPRTMLCLHGYGSSYRIAQILHKCRVTDATLISLNFPDHGITPEHDHEKVALGTIDELLPALYVLKECVIEDGRDAIDLYGFSAGGGAAINLIAALNTSAHDLELARIGIAAEEKKRLLDAIQNGVVILDVPLKSVDEIIDLRGTSPQLEAVAQKYRENNLRPIDSLDHLKGLHLDIIVHFQEPDETIFNRDDNLYIERLKAANALGTTTVIKGADGGHVSLHTSLWNHYSHKLQATR